MRPAARRWLRAAAALAVALAAWAVHYAFTPITLPQVPYDITVHPGHGVNAVAHQLVADGALPEGVTLRLLAHVTGKSRGIPAGTYRLDRALTPLEILDKLARGDVVILEVLFVEGTTWRQWAAQLATQPEMRVTLAGRSEAELRQLFGIEEPSLEGWFFPDTYRFAPGSTDVELLRRAHAVMKKHLADAWAGRNTAVPLASPYQALILASIVEKETALASERPVVAAVFLNRLKRGMRLQTDPTVIYGLGERYEGNIHKKDLTTDNPWNTYTRDGLPPTPISMPGAESIAAVAHPADADYLYFVSRGDGSHEFSRSLEEHNRAVAKYQLGR